MDIIIEKGDLTMCAVDVIVNPANERLVQGSGVDAAIHKKAGYQLANELRSIGGCKTGSTVVTNGYCLEAKHIIHTPTPHYEMDNSFDLLAMCFMNSLQEASQRGLRSIAFPALGAGFGGGFSNDEVARVARKSISDFVNNDKIQSIKKVYLVLFSEPAMSVFKKEFESYSKM